MPITTAAIIKAIVSPIAAHMNKGAPPGAGLPGKIVPSIMIASNRPKPTAVNIIKILDFLLKLIFASF